MPRIATLQEETRQLRELNQTSGQALKLCCAALDNIAGTHFSAQEAEIKASGRALMRELLQTGAAGAANAVRRHVWRRRAAELLPRMEFAVQQGGQWVVCGPGAENSSSGGLRALCPLAAME